MHRPRPAELPALSSSFAKHLSAVIPEFSLLSIFLPNTHGAARSAARAPLVVGLPSILSAQASLPGV